MSDRCGEFFEVNTPMMFKCGLAPGHAGDHGELDQDVLAAARDVTAERVPLAPILPPGTGTIALLVSIDDAGTLTVETAGALLYRGRSYVEMTRAIERAASSAGLLPPSPQMVGWAKADTVTYLLEAVQSGLHALRGFFSRSDEAALTAGRASLNELSTGLAKYPPPALPLAPQLNERPGG